MINRDIVCKELRSHKNNRILAQQFHVHPMTISHWRKKYNIQRFISKEECQRRILKLLKHTSDGVYQSDMVNVCGCSRQKIYWLLKKMEQEGLVQAIGNTTNKKWFLLKDKI